MGVIICLIKQLITFLYSFIFFFDNINIYLFFNFDFFSFSILIYHMKSEHHVDHLKLRSK